MTKIDWRGSALDTPSGAKLNLYSAEPNDKPRALVQINHGMAEHAGRYERFAQALVNAGYAVCAHDHRGHGLTTAADASLGRFAHRGGWNKVMEDVAAVNLHMKEKLGDTPTICFGHSMGSIIAFNAVLRYPDSYHGAALWNSGVDTGILGAVFKAILNIQKMFKGSDVPSGLAKKLTFETWNKQFSPNRTDYDWLSRDEAEVDKYVADPLCGFDVTIGLWLDLLDGIYFAADDKNLARLPLDFPVHLLAGADDPCSQNGKSVALIEKRMRQAELKDITFELLAETRHESLNEINHDQTTADFITWLDERFGLRNPVSASP